jgi:alkylhydroperoxidase family enzyme
MAFFDLPKDEELTPEVRQRLEEYRQTNGTPVVSLTWRAYARLPRIIEARFSAWEHLSQQSRFSWQARMVAVMLIAHTKRCQACFAGARFHLDKLGFDEATLDGYCAHPEALPLPERDRLFVHYALRIATSAADLQPKDFRDMEAHGFTRDDVQDMTAFVAYWVGNMIFSQTANAALRDD